MNCKKDNPRVDTNGNRLFRIRAIRTDTSEDEPYYIVATCKEAAVEVWFVLNAVDVDEGTELTVEQILDHNAMELR